MEESIQEAYQNKREEYNASLAKREEAIRQAFVLKVVTLIKVPPEPNPSLSVRRILTDKEGLLKDG